MELKVYQQPVFYYVIPETESFRGQVYLNTLPSKVHNSSVTHDFLRYINILTYLLTSSVSVRIPAVIGIRVRRFATLVSINGELFLWPALR